MVNSVSLAAFTYFAVKAKEVRIHGKMNDLKIWTELWLKNTKSKKYIIWKKLKKKIIGKKKQQKKIFFFSIKKNRKK